MQELGRWLLAAGVLLAGLGVVLMAGGRLPLGHLPGDFVYHRGGVTVYAPLGTMLVLSLLLTLVLNAWARH